MKYEFIIAENEHRTHELVVALEGTFHYCFYLERNAALYIEVFIMHQDVDLTIECVLRGEGAEARIAGVYGLHASNKVRINTVQHHQAAHTRSILVMRGIVRDSAHAYYHGIIRVEKDAHNADASQENKNMLMSNMARAVSEPQLEVLTNDVRCFHGSAVGRCDNEQLFYLQSRGIDE